MLQKSSPYNTAPKLGLPAFAFFKKMLVLLKNNLFLWQINGYDPINEQLVVA